MASAKRIYGASFRTDPAPKPLDLIPASRVTQPARQRSADSVRGSRLTLRSVKAEHIDVDTLSALSADIGEVTAGIARDADSQFIIDFDNALLSVLDEQPVTRVLLGRLGAGSQDYGIEVYDDAGSLILGATGLGIDVVGEQQLQDAAVASAKLQDLAVLQEKIANNAVGWTQMLTQGHNLLENGGFELGDVGWGTGIGFFIENDPANARTGNWVVRYQHDGTGGPNLFPANRRFKVEAGEQIYVSVWTRTPAGSGTMNLRVRWADADLSQIALTSVDLVSAAAASNWVKLSGFATAPSGAVYGWFDIGENSADNSLTPWYVDDAVMLRAVTTDIVVANAITANHISSINLSVIQAVVGELSAITADLGEIEAGFIRDSASNAAIRFDASFSLSGFTRYLDLTATGSNPFLHHTALDLFADGSAFFGGVVQLADSAGWGIEFLNTGGTGTLGMKSVPVAGGQVIYMGTDDSATGLTDGVFLGFGSAFGSVFRVTDVEFHSDATATFGTARDVLSDPIVQALFVKRGTPWFDTTGPNVSARFTTDVSGGTSTNHATIHELTQSAAAGVPSVALIGAMRYTHNTGTASTVAMGVEGFAELDGDGTVSSLRGVVGVAHLEQDGTITDAIGLLGAVTKSGGSVGTITSAYGLYIPSISAGSTNYAIYTNDGWVRFGDNIGFFDTMPVAKQTVDATSGTFTQTTMENLLTALENYGLITVQL